MSRQGSFPNNYTQSMKDQMSEATAVAPAYSRTLVKPLEAERTSAHDSPGSCNSFYRYGPVYLNMINNTCYGNPWLYISSKPQPLSKLNMINNKPGIA